MFEIGAGYGIKLGSMLAIEKLGKIHSKIELIGMDVTKPIRLPGVKMIQGNALTKPFPKADLIFSMLTIGAYIGNIGFLVRKTANALNEKGTAVLHVYNQDHAIRDIQKLRENLERFRTNGKLPGCKIRFQQGAFRDGPSVSFGDLAIIIEKD